MQIKNILLISIILFILNGCYVGSSTYKVFKENRNINIGDSLLHRGYTNKDRKAYNKKHYIYMLEHPKNCFMDIS